jgi:hypothetical protein
MVGAGEKSLGVTPNLVGRASEKTGHCYRIKGVTVVLPLFSISSCPHQMNPLGVELRQPFLFGSEGSPTALHYDLVTPSRIQGLDRGARDATASCTIGVTLLTNWTFMGFHLLQTLLHCVHLAIPEGCPGGRQETPAPPR